MPPHPPSLVCYLLSRLRRALLHLDGRWTVSLLVVLRMGMLLLCCLGARAGLAECPIRFHDVTQETGITFLHTDGSSGRRYIVETVTAGLATFDYDNDGHMDIYFLNGAPLPGTRTDGVTRNCLYRNDGSWRFTDVTDQVGVGDTGFGLGVAAADYDADGNLDLYVNNFGANVLYRNNGDGTFSDVTNAAGVADGNKVGAAVCFLDADGSGNLDLYVANYVKFTRQTHVETIVDGFPKYTGPKAYAPEPDTLYGNEGAGTFRDVSDEAGVTAHAGTGMGAVCLDYDNDGDTDIAVLNDVRGNFLFENDGRGRFRETGLSAGIAYSMDARALGSMGIDCADYDNDGWLDLFQTAYSGELPALFRNSGIGFFEDVTRSARAGTGAFSHVNWGVGFADFDNDGDRDLFIANGHLQDNVHLYDDTTSYEATNLVLMNDGNGRFENVSSECGDGLQVKRSSRGVALEDLDDDGRIDVVVLNSRRQSTVLRNESKLGNHWIQIQLRGVKTNRDGVGARVQVVSGDLTLIDEVHSGRGYQSHYGSRLHFGLGQRRQVDRLEIRWLGGDTEVLESIPVDQTISIVEGSGNYVTLP